MSEATNTGTEGIFALWRSGRRTLHSTLLRLQRQVLLLQRLERHSSGQRKLDTRAYVLLFDRVDC